MKANIMKDKTAQYLGLYLFGRMLGFGHLDNRPFERALRQDWSWA